MGNKLPTLRPSMLIPRYIDCIPRKLNKPADVNRAKHLHYQARIYAEQKDLIKVYKTR